ncbi:hypothetical protein Tco_0834828 [Tanacetum coccineum]
MVTATIRAFGFTEIHKSVFGYRFSNADAFGSSCKQSLGCIWFGRFATKGCVWFAQPHKGAFGLADSPQKGAFGLREAPRDDISDIVVLKEFVTDSVVNLMRFCCESHVIVISSLGVKGRRGRDSPKKGRVPMSERFLNPTPITQYNPVTNEVVKESGKENPDVVVVNEKLDVVNENPDVVKGKPDFVKENPASVKEKTDCCEGGFKIHKEKVDKEAITDKASVQDDPGNSSTVIVSKDKRKGVNDKVLDVVAKDKPKGSASFVVVSKDMRKQSSEKEACFICYSNTEFDQLHALFQKDKALNVVSKDKPKGNASSELPNKKEKANIPKILSNEDHSKKKPEVDYDSSSDEVSDRKPKKGKIKAEVKRKRKGGPDSDSDSFNEEDHSKKQKKLKRKRNDSDSDSLSIDRETIKRMINKLQKKVKKESDEETTPVSLFSAIRNSSVDMLRFLNNIGFSSLNNVSIDKLPMKLGWFVVSRFKNYKLSFNTGDQIEVTRSKIHDVLGIPVGGYSLFKLDERETGDEFVKEWADQFSPIVLKKIRVNDIARKLTKTEVKKAEGFIGSVEDSKKVDLFKRAEEKLASICSERVRLEDLLRKANSDYHGDGKFVELQEKYVQVFKDPISFDVGMNSVDGDDGDDDDGDGNGDDDGTRDDDARGDSDVNRDDDNADSRNDDDVGGDGNGNEDDAGNGDDEDGGCKSIEKQVDATTKEVDATTKEVDATTKENVVEESDEITCTPESFSQWIDANSDFVLEQIDCVVDEYLYVIF